MNKNSPKSFKPIGTFWNAQQIQNAATKKPIQKSIERSLWGLSAAFVVSAVATGGLIEYQYRHPTTLPGYFVDELPNHTGECEPYVHHPIGSKIYELQPLKQSLRTPNTFTQQYNFVLRTAYADFRSLAGTITHGERPATGFEARDRCESHPKDRKRLQSSTPVLWHRIPPKRHAIS